MTYPGRGGAPYWLWVLITILVILAILWLLGIGIHVGR